MRWLEAFNTAGESTTLDQMNSGKTATVGNYSPPVDGTIKKIAIIVASTAATSLVEGVRIELESTDWSPNRLEFIVEGSGLRTAPGVVLVPWVYDVNLKMSKTTPIRGDYIHFTGTPVTSNIAVLFGFD
ncbi:MAG TPA: hypothetical protein VJN63_09120 [Thermoplasmata archaeon]|nr:hypothetical protein [Thermoplasmata archaeon]